MGIYVSHRGHRGLREKKTYKGVCELCGGKGLRGNDCES